MHEKIRKKNRLKNNWNRFKKYGFGILVKKLWIDERNSLRFKESVNKNQDLF